MNFVDAVDNVIVINAVYRGVLNFLYLYRICKSETVYHIVGVMVVNHAKKLLDLFSGFWFMSEFLSSSRSVGGRITKPLAKFFLILFL